MARSRCPELDAVAVRLLALLADYEAGVSRLVLHWHEQQDWEHYTRVSSAFDEVRNTCGAQPKVSVPFLELLISHVELMETLPRGPHGAASTPLVERYADHLHCIKSLQETCRQLLAEPP